MENQLLTPPKSSENKLPPHILAKDNIIKKIKDNINYIYIVLMIVANCLIALVTIEDGKITMHYPGTILGWVLWATQILLQTIIGVLILNGFRRQGIKIGHNSIKSVYDEYLTLTRKNTENKNPRSLKQYLTGHAAKDSIIKSCLYIILSIFMGSVVIGANWNALLSLVVNIIFAVGFGIKALLDSEEFVIKELVIWYRKEIDQLNKINEKEKKNENSKRKRIIRSTRPTKSGGIQQEEECRTRQETCNIEQSNKSTS